LFIIHLIFFARRFVDRRFEHDDGTAPEPTDGPRP